MKAVACCVLLVMTVRELILMMIRFRKMAHSENPDEQKKFFARIMVNTIFIFTLIYAMGRVVV